MKRFLAALGVLALLLPPFAAADSPITKEDDAAAKRVWLRILHDAGRNPDYAKLLRAWIDDPEIRQRFERSEIVKQYLEQTSPEVEKAKDGATRTWEQDTARNQSRLARSLNAAATNPRRVGLLERSGIVDFVALAVHGTNFVSADETAVTLNLNAARLLAHPGKDKMKHTSAWEYAHGGALNRLGGSFTFGEKLPEEDITGFSGLPDADKLLDAVSWDVKWRLVGDRDPRAAKWQGLFQGYLGALMGKASDLASYPETPDEARPIIVSELQDAIAPRATQDVLDTIGRSLQVSLKASGQHLSREKGMNKYTVALLADEGMGVMDGTLNVSYSKVQNVPKDSTTVYTLKQWRVTLGFTGTVLKDALVAGRGSELAVGAEGLFPHDGADVPMKRKRVFKADVALTFPVSQSAEIPFSVTWTNDPDNLSKQRYVRGQIGINYDFGSLKKLIQGE